MVAAHLLFTASDFLHLGLQYHGWSDQKIKRNSLIAKMKNFRDRFYVSPQTCENIFNDLLSTEIEEARTKKPVPDEILCALNFLKEYPLENNLAGLFGVNSKSSTRWAETYTRKISALAGSKVRNRTIQSVLLYSALTLFNTPQIKWLFDEDRGKDEVFILSVDGVHCKICEPRTEPSSQWYSHKSNGAGLTYELGIAIFHNQLCWINGPFQAATNDMAVFRKPDGLQTRIPRGKKVVADEGYTGEPWMLSTRNPLDSKLLKDFKRRTKARHESFNSRLKRFAILSGTFRGRNKKNETKLEQHKRVFVACCVLAQYEMEFHPLFEV